LPFQYFGFQPCRFTDLKLILDIIRGNVPLFHLDLFPQPFLQGKDFLSGQFLANIFSSRSHCKYNLGLCISSPVLACAKRPLLMHIPEQWLRVKNEPARPNADVIPN
jgi:hypothetical protein